MSGVVHARTRICSGSIASFAARALAIARELEHLGGLGAVAGLLVAGAGLVVLLEQPVEIAGLGGLTGGFEVARRLLLLAAVPVVLGEGKPLFDQRLPLGAMQLQGMRGFENGMVELRYEISG